jgi:outer membrane protein assembly factor BamB
MMRLCLRLSPALVLAGLLAACSSDKVVHQPLPLVEIPRHSPDSVWFAEQWQHRVGKGDGGEFLRLRPAVGETALYAASRNGRVMAFDKASGKLLWAQRSKHDFTGAVGAGYGLVVAGTAKGELVALDAATGAPRWAASDLTASVLSAPVVDANVVVVMCGDGKVYGYKREDGQRLWVHDTPVPPLSLRGNATPLISNGVVYIATASGKVEALQVADGVPVWDTRVASNLGRSELERIVDVDGDLLVDEIASVLYSAGYQSQITAVDTGDGHRLWQSDMSSVAGVTSGSGNVYTADVDGTLYGLDAVRGRSVWKQGVLAWRQPGAPLAFGGVLLVGDAEGFVHVIAQADGSVVGRFRQGSSPVLALRADAGTVYVYSADGRLGAWQRTPFPPRRMRLVKQGLSPWAQDQD